MLSTVIYVCMMICYILKCAFNCHCSLRIFLVQDIILFDFLFVSLICLYYIPSVVLIMHVDWNTE